MFKTKAYAKLDLAIHITPKKKVGGYYPVHYIDCQINLADELIFEAQKGKITVICESLELSNERENFVYRAAQNLKKIVGGKELGAKITLKKNIPIRAGFGGGSSDGAATLLGLSKLWKVNVSKNQIRELAHALGKDFYYSVWGGLSEVVGDGKNYDVVQIKSRMADFWLLVVVPKEEKPSTGWVYDHLKRDSLGKNSDKIKKLKKAFLKRDKMGILKNLNNDFENSVSSYYPVVLRIKEDLAKAGAGASIMAGSGLSVVGFFESQKEAEVGKEQLKGKYRQILVARTIN